MDDPNQVRAGWQAYAIGSAFFAALTAILGKVAVSEINSNLATLIRTVVILLVAAAIVSVRGEWETPGRLSRLGVLMLVLSGAATGLSWLCYYRALAMAPASRVAPIDKLSVALVIVLAVVFLGEPLTWRVAAGGGLVVAGVLVLATGGT
jgi:bacterial/archaeal transporter family protein